MTSNAVRFTNPAELARPPGYSNVVEVLRGRIVYIAGQIAVDKEGKLVGKGDFEAQAHQAFANVGTALRSVGCTPRDLVKLTVYIRDMSQVPLYRKARDRFLGSVTPPAAPAMTLVEVSRLFSDDFLIEVEAVAAAEHQA
jgi:enamine deaminase RidA (YjgF/YER057c/UK114 family)